MFIYRPKLITLAALKFNSEDENSHQRIWKNWPCTVQIAF